MSPNSIEFYLLAAGKGERLGGSKPLLPFGPTTIFQRMVAEIRDAGIDKVRVIGTKDKADLAKLAFDIGVRYIINLEPERGMAGSIIDALDDCTSDWLALCPADMPLLTSQAIQRCFSQISGDAVQPVSDGRRKHPVFLNVSWRTALRAHLKDQTLRDFLVSRSVTEVDCEPPWQFDDIDTPDDYNRLLTLAGYGPN